MANKVYWSKTTLIGGAATALDSIDGDDLTDGDVSHVWASGIFYVYRLNASSAASESIPYVIAPDANAGDKRWILEGCFNVAQIGYFQRPVFGVTDANTITIGPGMYDLACSDGVNRLVYWNSALTKDVSVSGTQSYNLFIDESSVLSGGVNLLTADNFILTTDAASYDVAKHGVYNGYDRCIMGFHVVGGNLVSIYHDGGDFVGYPATVTSRATSDLATRAAVTLSIPSFCTKATIFVGATLNASAITLNGSSADANNQFPLVTGIEGVLVSENVTVFTSSLQAIYLWLSNYDGTNNVAVYTVGWFFPAGM